MICKCIEIFLSSILYFIINVNACDEGWINYKNEKCIKIILSEDKITNKAEAKQGCEHLGSKLLTIHSREKQLFISFLLGNQKLPAFIGLSRKQHPNGSNSNQFEWDDGSVLDFQYWSPGEPNIITEGCVEIFSSQYYYGGWNDVRCDSKRGFICEKVNVDPRPDFERNLFKKCSDSINDYIRYDEFCYKVYNNELNWNQAERRCQQDHANSHLVSIISGYEHAFTQYLAIRKLNSNKFWIGLKSHHKSLKIEWQWNDEWPLYYQSWAQRINSKANLSESCVVENLKNGKWKLNSHCSEKNAFICKINTKPAPGEEQYENAFCPNLSHSRENHLDWINLYTKSKFCYWNSGSQQLNWEDANNVCMQRNATLMSVHSDHELLLLHPFMKSRSDNIFFWFGLFKDPLGEFKWEDGSKLDFIKWASGQPKQASGFDCGIIYLNTMKWFNIECEKNKASFICGVEKIVPNLRKPEEHKRISSTTIIIILMGLLLFAAILAAVFIYCYFSKKRFNSTQNDMTKTWSKTNRNTRETDSNRYDSFHDEYQTGEYSEVSALLDRESVSESQNSQNLTDDTNNDYEEMNFHQ